MTTDYEKLLQNLSGENTRKAYMLRCTLTKLIDLVNKGTGKLPSELYVQEYAVDKELLKEILTDLGYSILEFEEEYNPYFEQYCYKIKLG